MTSQTEAWVEQARKIQPHPFVKLLLASCTNATTTCNMQSVVALGSDRHLDPRHFSLHVHASWLGIYSSYLLTVASR